MNVRKIRKMELITYLVTILSNLYFSNSLKCNFTCAICLYFDVCYGTALKIEGGNVLLSKVRDISVL